MTNGSGEKRGPRHEGEALSLLRTSSARGWQEHSCGATHRPSATNCRQAVGMLVLRNGIDTSRFGWSIALSTGAESQRPRKQRS
jgi:hypothetical protein